VQEAIVRIDEQARVNVEVVLSKRSYEMESACHEILRDGNNNIQWCHNAIKDPNKFYRPRVMDTGREAYCHDGDWCSWLWQLSLTENMARDSKRFHCIPLTHDTVDYMLKVLIARGGKDDPFVDQSSALFNEKWLFMLLYQFYEEAESSLYKDLGTTYDATQDEEAIGHWKNYPWIFAREATVKF
jgi:hypothetical protein